MIDDEADFGDILDESAEAQTAAARFRPKARPKSRKITTASNAVRPIPTVRTSVEKAGALTQQNASQQLKGEERAALTHPGNYNVEKLVGFERVVDTSSGEQPTVSLASLSNPNVATGAATSGASAAVHRASQDEGHNDDPSEEARHHETLVVSDTQASSSLSTSKTIDDLADLSGVVDTLMEDVDLQDKVDDNHETGCSDEQLQGPRHQESVPVSTATPEDGLSNIDVVPQDKEDGSHEKDHNDDPCQKSVDQESLAVNTRASLDVDGTVDLDSHDELRNPSNDDTPSISGEPSVEPTVKFQTKIGRKKGKGRSVSFVLQDASVAVAPMDTNSDMSNLSYTSKDISTDENLTNFPHQAAEKHCIAEDQHSNDREYTDRESVPADHAVEERPKSDAGQIGSSMKLRSRKKLQKVGIPEHTADDNFDEDYVEPSVDEQDTDGGDEYTAGGKQKVRKKSREKGISKEPLRGSKCASKDSSLEESAQQKLQKNKTEASSRGRKRTLKDSSTEQPEKKLTHRIRQKRREEINTLLETPEHEINRMKLSVMHLRLLQEARERIMGKEPSDPSSSHQSSEPAGYGDDFDFFGDKELENHGNDGTNNHALQNVTKLNYHSYMNKKARVKWSKSDTDLFYQGLRQFGTDFAMIQQLFPDRTRDQVRQKFKTEEKKRPMQVHDAIIHRSTDNLYFKKVIKHLNIQDVQPEISSTHNLEGASNGTLENENTLNDLTNKEEEEGDLDWSDKEQITHSSDAKHEEQISENADDDLDDVFDWY